MRVLAALLIALSGALAHAEPSLLLREAVSQAELRDPVVEKARKGVEISEAQYRAAISALLPNVELSASSLFKKDALNTGNPRFGGESYNAYQFGIQAVQPLYRGGGALAALSAADKDRLIRKIDLEIAERDLGRSVVTAYYRVLLSESRLHSLEKTRDLEEKMLATAKSRYEIGREQLADVLQIKTQLALLAPEIQSAENQVELSAAELANLLGEREKPEIVPQGVLPAISLSKVTEELSRKKPRIPELERMGLLIEQGAKQRRALLAAHYPQLNAVANIGRSSFVKAELLDQYSTSWSMGFQLAIPLFSGLSSFQDRARFAAQEVQQELERRDLEDQISLRQIQAAKDLELARRQLESWAQAFQYAGESLQESQKSYRLQTIDYLKLLEAQRNYLSAQVSFENAKYNAIVAVSTYTVSQGFSIWDLVEILSRAGH